MSRLVVISNRLPLGDNPSGGLVVALADALSRSGGLWVGFSGEPVEAPGDTLTFHGGAAFQRAAFDLTPQEHQDYYLGFSNSVLWPVCHGRADLMDIQPQFLDTYQRVNDRIAALIAPELMPGDRIWVQDFHLFPLARALRERGVTAPIGMFLHIPFPGPNDAAALPGAEDLYEWLSHFDLIGLQAERDVANFLECARQLARFEDLGGGRVRLMGRDTTVGAFPIGIDAAGFMQEARSSRAKDRMRTLTGAEIMIGVDRLDYSKGIPNRFRAFQMLLDTYPDLRKKIAFLQIAPPTRQEVAAYQDIREETEHLAGRINGQFASINWTPIRYIHRAFPRDALAGLYRQARIGLVTPLADGMNLVAKEYVAAQDSADPGVLILSRFAGAAEQMDQALIINPHDPWELSEAMNAAIRMPATERRRRYAALLEGVLEQDVRWWSRRYLNALDKAAQ